MGPTEIERSINNADLHRQFNVRTGDCSSVAEGIRRVFGGQLKAISSVPEEQYFDHVVVHIDSQLYDGRGHVSWATVEDEFVPTSQWTTSEEHWFTVDDITADSMYSERIAAEVANSLQVAQADVQAAGGQ